MSGPGELELLAAHGILGLSLDYRIAKRQDEYGNRFYYRADVYRTAESRVAPKSYDVYLTSKSDRASKPLLPQLIECSQLLCGITPYMVPAKCHRCPIGGETQECPWECDGYDKCNYLLDECHGAMNQPRTYPCTTI